MARRNSGPWFGFRGLWLASVQLPEQGRPGGQSHRELLKQISQGPLAGIRIFDQDLPSPVPITAASAATLIQGILEPGGRFWRLAPQLQPAGLKIAFRAIPGRLIQWVYSSVTTPRVIS